MPNRDPYYLKDENDKEYVPDIEASEVMYDENRSIKDMIDELNKKLLDGFTKTEEGKTSFDEQISKLSADIELNSDKDVKTYAVIGDLILALTESETSIVSITNVRELVDILPSLSRVLFTKDDFTNLEVDDIKLPDNWITGKITHILNSYEFEVITTDGLYINIMHNNAFLGDWNCIIKKAEKEYSKYFKIDIDGTDVLYADAMQSYINIKNLSLTSEDDSVTATAIVEESDPDISNIITFVVPVSGAYLIHADISFMNSNSSDNIKNIFTTLLINGVRICSPYHVLPGESNSICMINSVMELPETNRLSVLVFHDIEEDITINTINLKFVKVG